MVEIIKLAIVVILALVLLRFVFKATKFLVKLVLIIAIIALLAYLLL